MVPSMKCSFKWLKGFVSHVEGSNPLRCKQFLGASLPAKLDHYPICVEGALYMSPRFT
jgi:hypothetical protein